MGMLLHTNNENTPPAVTNLELVTHENMPIIISLVAQDPDNDLVTFSIVSLPRQEACFSFPHMPRKILVVQ